jgi:transcription elongation GreA/GreB family factor
MSKAFTKEDDSEPERNTRVRSLSGLPPGALNYMTASGAGRMEMEIEEIRETEPQRAAQIRRILDTAMIVKPPTDHPEEVLFGTSVEVRNADGHSRTFRIVGVDEVEFDSSFVSWISPIGKSLLGAVVGQRVMLDLYGEPTAFRVIRINH